MQLSQFPSKILLYTNRLEICIVHYHLPPISFPIATDLYFILLTPAVLAVLGVDQSEDRSLFKYEKKIKKCTEKIKLVLVKIKDPPEL